MRLTAGAIVAILALIVLGSSIFAVDETEHAVVLRFGEPVRSITNAGLKVKWPFPIDRVVRFDRRLMVFDVPSADEPALEFLTLDKKNIEVSSYACWRIEDPRRFLETVGDRDGVEAYLRDFVLSEQGKVLGRRNLSALISVKPDDIEIESITTAIRDTCNQAALRECGVTVVDFRIKRVNYPEQNRNSVFERMQAERKQIATRYRSEGEREAIKIRAEADRERMEILAQAKRQALATEGDAEAKAARIYNDAYGKNPSFYEFLRTLESYESSLNEGTTILLPSNMRYLRTFLEATKASSGRSR
ncbi:MAG: protease modulator HflC [Candidatus Latescibacterota bacterium]|nr:MAG: protease modulator HflC [Candidatus Latescibacterota bacterium]